MARIPFASAGGYYARNAGRNCQTIYEPDSWLLHGAPFVMVVVFPSKSAIRYNSIARISKIPNNQQNCNDVQTPTTIRKLVASDQLYSSHDIQWPLLGHSPRM